MHFFDRILCLEEKKFTDIEISQSQYPKIPIVRFTYRNYRIELIFKRLSVIKANFLGAFIKSDKSGKEFGIFMLTDFI